MGRARARRSRTRTLARLGKEPMSPPSQPASQTRQFCPAPTARGRAEGLGASRYCGRGEAGLWAGGAGAGRYCGGGVGGRLLHTASDHDSPDAAGWWVCGRSLGEWASEARLQASHDLVLCVVTDRSGGGAERLLRATGGHVRRGAGRASAGEPWRAKDGHAVRSTGGREAPPGGLWRRGGERVGWRP